MREVAKIIARDINECIKKIAEILAHCLIFAEWCDKIERKKIPRRR